MDSINHLKNKNKNKEYQKYLDDLNIENKSFLEQSTDFLLSRIKTDFKEQDFIDAKEEFFSNFGKVFHDDPFYKEKMDYFVNYFIFEHPIKNNETIFQIYYKDLCEYNPIWNSFYDIRHSLWSIERIDQGSILVKDLILNLFQIIDVSVDQSFVGFKNQDVFQGFILFFKRLCLLKEGIVIHPKKIQNTLNEKLSSNSFSYNKDHSHKILEHMSMKQTQFLRVRGIDPTDLYFKDWNKLE